MNIVSVFNSEEGMLKALENLKESGVKAKEIYTPYPVHEVLEFMEERSRMTIAAWFYGLGAGVSVLAFLIYTSVIDWPLNYGGKPSSSFPSFIVITLILVILSVTLLSLLTFSWRANLFPGKKDETIDPRATDDKFVVVFGEKQIQEHANLKEILSSIGAEEVYEK